MIFLNWQPKTVIVTFDLNGGSGEQPPAIDTYYGATLDSLPDGTGITKPGGTFIGWTRDGEDFSITDPILGDTVLVAKWQMEEVTITFEPQDGTDPIVINTYYGEFIEAPEVTRDDYILVGWTTEPSGGEAFDPNEPVTGDKTYYAQWVDEFYTVTFDTDGGSEIQPVRVQYGKPVEKPTDPTKEKFKFHNWTLNGVVYDFDQPVTSNITLLANWINVWDVTFDLNGGEGNAPDQHVDDGDYATKPEPDPTNGDCPFEGWKEEDGSGGDEVTGDGTLADLQRAVELGVGPEYYPVGREFNDNWNGQDNPLIVAQYLDSTNNEAYGGAEGVILVRKYIEPSMQFSLIGSDTYATSDVKSFLDNDYITNCSPEIQSVIGDINIPCYNVGAAKMTTVKSKWFIMSTYEMCNKGNQGTAGYEGIMWQYWKGKTGLTEPDNMWTANAGRNIPTRAGTTARDVWFRTQYGSGSICNIWGNGNVGNNGPTATCYLLPACFIGKSSS